MAAASAGARCDNPDLHGALIPAVAAIGADDDNRTARYARTLAPYLGRELARALR